MLRYLVLMVLCATPAFAQQQAPSTPLDQALGQKLMTEINDGIQCRAGTIALQNSLSSLQMEVAKAQARVKELEAKYEPKPTETSPN